MKHISELLDREQLGLYKQAIEALDEIEGLHLLTPAELLHVDFDKVKRAEELFLELPYLMFCIYANSQGEDVESENLPVLIQSSDRWACTEKKHNAQGVGSGVPLSLLAWRQLQDLPFVKSYVDEVKSKAKKAMTDYVSV
jgi:hypothetical protein